MYRKLACGWETKCTASRPRRSNMRVPSSKSRCTVKSNLSILVCATTLVANTICDQRRDFTAASRLISAKPSNCLIDFHQCIDHGVVALDHGRQFFHTSLVFFVNKMCARFSSLLFFFYVVVSSFILLGSAPDHSQNHSRQRPILY